VHDQDAEQKGQHRCGFGSDPGSLLVVLPITGYDENDDRYKGCGDKPWHVVVQRHERGCCADNGEKDEIAAADAVRVLGGHLAFDPQQEADKGGQAELEEQLQEQLRRHSPVAMDRSLAQLSPDLLIDILSFTL